MVNLPPPFRVQCKERTKVFEVDFMIVNMSPLFSDMYADLSEQSDCITLDFAEEATFAKVLEFCEKSIYSDR